MKVGLCARRNGIRRKGDQQATTQYGTPDQTEREEGEVLYPSVTSILHRSSFRARQKGRLPLRVCEAPRPSRWDGTGTAGLPGIVISFMLYPLTPPTRPTGRQARRGLRSTFQSISGFEKGFLRFSYNMEGNKMGSIQYFIRRNAVSRPVLDEILRAIRGRPGIFSLFYPICSILRFSDPWLMS